MYMSLILGTYCGESDVGGVGVWVESDGCTSAEFSSSCCLQQVVCSQSHYSDVYELLTAPTNELLIWFHFIEVEMIHQNS